MTSCVKQNSSFARKQLSDRVNLYLETVPEKMFGDGDKVGTNCVQWYGLALSPLRQHNTICWTRHHLELQTNAVWNACTRMFTTSVGHHFDISLTNTTDIHIDVIHFWCIPVQKSWVFYSANSVGAPKCYGSSLSNASVKQYTIDCD